MPEVKVEAMVRVRPFNRRELDLVRKENQGETKPIVSMNGRRVAVLNPDTDFQEHEAFDFDEAFWSIPKEQMMSGGIDLNDPSMLAVAKQMGIDHVVGQQEVYVKSGARCITHAFEGFHSCIFAYGQTGAGKTFTMMGGLDEKGGLDDSPKGREMRGVCLRLVEDLFSRIQERKDQGEKTVFRVYLSFMEIYKEKCKDLLIKAGKKKSVEDAEKDYADLKVRHSPTDGTYVQGLERKEIKNPEQCFSLMAYGMNCRHTAATKMNDVSSRSHAIFQITFKQSDPLAGVNTLSTINLVDLAGSERIKMSGATEGTRRDEATKINLSLSTLRRVIDVLVDNAKKKQQTIAPYRESMLTWVLMESLGGNSKTIMIAAVSPFAGNFEDTLNTLRYANKAKEIVCKAKRNDEKGQLIVSAMRGEMDRLKAELAKKSEEMDEAARARLEADLQEQQQELERAEAEEEELRQQREALEQAHLELQAHADEQAAQADELRRMEEETAGLAEKRKEMERAMEEAKERAAQVAIDTSRQERERREFAEQKRRLEEERLELQRKEAITLAEMRDTKHRQMAGAFKAALMIWRDRREFQDLQSRQGKATERLEQAREAAAEQASLLASRKARIESERKREAELNAERDKREADAVQERANLEKKIADTNDAIVKLRDTVTDLESEIETAEADLETMRQGTEQGRSDSQGRTERLANEANDALKGTQECEREAAGGRARAHKAKGEADMLEREHERLAAESRVVTRKLAEAEQELAAMSARYNQLHRDAAAAAQGFQTAGEERRRAEQGINRISDQMRRVDRALHGSLPPQDSVSPDASPQRHRVPATTVDGRWNLRRAPAPGLQPGRPR
eukprot:Hpha_TRINITY_DN8744_c0_g1::TRINITY_DN8744_c0_g1_i1::g.45229::m.45229